MLVSMNDLAGLGQDRQALQPAAPPPASPPNLALVLLAGGLGIATGLYLVMNAGKSDRRTTRDAWLSDDEIRRRAKEHRAHKDAASRTERDDDPWTTPVGDEVDSALGPVRSRFLSGESAPTRTRSSTEAPSFSRASRASVPSFGRRS